MNVLGMVFSGIKKIFKGPNALLKHVCIFAIAGFISVATINIQNAGKDPTPDISAFITCFITLLIVSIYMSGYIYQFLHNFFYEEKEEYLPEIDLVPIKRFFSALPLVLCWGAYNFLALGLVILCFASQNIALMILGSILSILLALAYSFIQFIFVAFSKNFDKRGLFNILLPFQYLKYSFADIVILGIVFIPIYILAMIPSGAAGLAIGLTGAITNQDMGTSSTLIGGILGGYFGTIVQYIWNYCAVQIYKEKIEPNMI